MAGSRAEFLTALARGGFDLVLADYRLPGFDGLQALALWRERRPDTPFLFVTGSPVLWPGEASGEGVYHGLG